jgi:2,5-diketo-D-gluconate reductase B
MKIIQHQNSSLPALGFGTFRMQGEECYNATRAALDIGYRHLDTAQAYENEEEVGRALDDSDVSRDDIFLTTKCHKDKLTAQQVREGLDESLSKLRTDAVDLLLIHWPSADVPMQETLEAMQEAQARGKTRHIGVSNFTVALLREATETHGAVLFTN